MLGSAAVREAGGPLLLDWTLLRSFLAVVETGSLSAAAATVGQSQPTLSRHIRELEAELGVILFNRSASGLEPTEAAQGLIEDARTMGAAADALALKARGRSQDLGGTVRITASVMVANVWLPPIVTDLRRAEPNIQIEIVPTDLTQSLLRRDADIAIRMADPVERALVARKLGEAAVGLYGTRDYFARRGRIATMQDLLSHDVIGFDRSETILDLYAEKGHPVTREAFPIRCDDQMVCWHLMLAGAGLGFAQALIAKCYPSLERVDLDLVPPMPVWLVLHEDVRANPRIRRVADVLAGAIAALLRAG